MNSGPLFLLPSVPVLYKALWINLVKTTFWIHLPCFACDSGRTETISELLASVRRQGVRAESLLKDSDNLIQRYRNLEARLLRQADAQKSLEGECGKFMTQAESTRSWIADLLQPLTSPGTDTQKEEMKNKAQVSEPSLKPDLINISTFISTFLI